MGDARRAGDGRQHADRHDGRRDAAGERVRRGHRERRRSRTRVLDVLRHQLRRLALRARPRAASRTASSSAAETFPADIDELWRLVQRPPARDRGLHLDRLGLPRRGRHRPRRLPGRGLRADRHLRRPTRGSPAGSATSTSPATGGPCRTTARRSSGCGTSPTSPCTGRSSTGAPTFRTPWSWTDSVSSWSWDVPAGLARRRSTSTATPTRSSCFSNGRSLGRAAVGAEKAFIARFDVAYEPGELVAVAYVAGEEQARTALRTADDPLRLDVTADRDTIRADDTDLAYVEITLETTTATSPTTATGSCPCGCPARARSPASDRRTRAARSRSPPRSARPSTGARLRSSVPPDQVTSRSASTRMDASAVTTAVTAAEVPPDGAGHG